MATFSDICLLQGITSTAESFDEAVWLLKSILTKHYPSLDRNRSSNHNSASRKSKRHSHVIRKKNGLVRVISTFALTNVSDFQTAIPPEMTSLPLCIRYQDTMNQYINVLCSVSGTKHTAIWPIDLCQQSLQGRAVEGPEAYNRNLPGNKTLGPRLFSFPIHFPRVKFIECFVAFLKPGQ